MSSRPGRPRNLRAKRVPVGGEDSDEEDERALQTAAKLKEKQRKAVSRGGSKRATKENGKNARKSKKKMASNGKPLVSQSMPALSFDDDEEDGADPNIELKLKKKKTKTRQRLAHLEKKALERQQKGETTASQPSLYSKEELARLRSESRLIGGGTTSYDTVSDSAKVEMEAVTPMEVDTDSIETYAEADTQNDGSTPNCDVDIPDEFQIRRARNKREQARAHLTGDYVPLAKTNDPSRLLASEDIAPGESTLVREDGDDLDETIFHNDDDNMIQFGDPGRIQSDLRKKSLVEALQIETEAEEDESNEEMRRWELEQIKKGGADLKEVKARQAAARVRDKLKKGIRAGAASAPALMPSNINVTSSDEILKKMEARLNELDTIISTQSQSLQRITDGLEDSRGSVAKLQTEEEGIMTQLRFFQEYYDFIENLASCLEEKAEAIDALVDKNLSIIRDAVHFTRKQQQLVYAEEVYELADEKEFNHVLGDGRLLLASEEAEFGREAHLLWKQKRNQYRANRINKTAPNEACPGWGESAEELLSFRDENAAHRFDQLEEEASEVFDDVLPEYYMLSEVIKRLRAFSANYPQLFLDSYCYLSVPELVGPLIKFDLMRWSWREASYRDRSWYQTMVKLQDNTANDGIRDAWKEALRKIVEKIVVVDILKKIELEFDVSSSALNTALQRVFYHLVEDCGANSRVLDMVKLTLSATFTGTVSRSPIPHFRSNGNAQCGLMVRRCWRLCQILEGICSWWKAIDPSLFENAITKIFTRDFIPVLLNKPALPFNITCLKQASRHIYNSLSQVMEGIPVNYFRKFTSKNGPPGWQSLASFLVGIQSHVTDSDLRQAVECMQQLLGTKTDPDQ